MNSKFLTFQNALHDISEQERLKLLKGSFGLSIGHILNSDSILRVTVYRPTARVQSCAILLIQRLVVHPT